MTLESFRQMVRNFGGKWTAPAVHFHNTGIQYHAEVGGFYFHWCLGNTQTNDPTINI